MNSLYSFYKGEIAGNHFFEWFIIFICFLILAQSEFLLKKFNVKISKYFDSFQQKYPYIIINYRVISLIISVIILSIGLYISYYFSGYYSYILKLLKVATILLIYNICTIFTKNTLQLRIVSLLIAIPIILKTLGVLDLIITDLDLIGFEVGKVNLTLLLLVKTIYIASILFWIGKYISKISESYIKSKSDWNINTKAVLLKFFNIFLYIFLVIVGLNIIGFDFTILTFLSAAFGIGITLSTQKIASNFLSGIILLFEKSIKVNDVIEVHNGVKGKVKYLGIRTTVIDTQDGSEIIVPNEDIIGSKIISWSGKKNQLVQSKIILELSVENDPGKVCQIFFDYLNNHSRCSSSPKPKCVAENFVRNNIEYEITFWTLKENRSEVRVEILNKIWLLMKDNNIKPATY